MGHWLLTSIFSSLFLGFYKQICCSWEQLKNSSVNSLQPTYETHLKQHHSMQNRRPLSESAKVFHVRASLIWSPPRHTHTPPVHPQCKFLSLLPLSLFASGWLLLLQFGAPRINQAPSKKLKLNWGLASPLLSSHPLLSKSSNTHCRTQQRRPGSVTYFPSRPGDVYIHAHRFLPKGTSVAPPLSVPIPWLCWHLYTNPPHPSTISLAFSLQSKHWKACVGRWFCLIKLFRASELQGPQSPAPASFAIRSPTSLPI